MHLKYFLQKAFCIISLLSTSSLYAQQQTASVYLDNCLLNGLNYCDLNLNFEIIDNNWNSNIMGYSAFYSAYGQYDTRYASLNKRDHIGIINSMQKSGSNVQLDITMDIKNDPWVSGGIGKYNIKFDIIGDTIIGSYSGIYRDSIPVNGTVEGKLKISLVKKINNFNPIARGEHPRLIFRKSELADIKYKALNTPEGQAMMNRLNSSLTYDFKYSSREPSWYAAGMALKYILTDDVVWAEKAKKVMDSIMNITALTTKMISLAPRYMGVAIAYDFMYDYLEQTDKKFRESTCHWLEQKSLEIIEGGGEGYNSHPMSNWMCIANGSLGVISMAIMGDSVRFIQPEPIAPQKTNYNPVNVAVGAGLDASDFVSNELITNWVCVGSFNKTEPTDDCLTSIGGTDNANPQIGTVVNYNQTDYTFKLIDTSQHIYIRDNEKYIDVTKLWNHAYFTTSYYYTIINNPTARWIKVNLAKFGQTKYRMWLANKEVRNGDVIYISSGKYPLMLAVDIDVCDPWGTIAVRPILQEATPEEAEAIYQHNMLEYNIQHYNWTKKYNQYLNNNKTTSSADDNLRIAVAGMKRWLTSGLGDHGWYTEGEGYLRFAMTCGGGQFLHAYRTVLGYDLADMTGASWILPKVAMEAVSGKMWAWGPAGWGNFDMQEERSGCFNSLFSSCYPEHLPAIKWIYDKQYGLAGNSTFNIQTPYQAAYALKNYPWDVIAQNPYDVFKNKTQNDIQKGYYIARNAYTYTTDLVTDIFLKSQYLIGTHEANDQPETRIMAFNKNIAQLEMVGVSDVVNNQQGGGIIKHEQSHDGSVILSANFDDAYLGVWNSTSKIYPDLGIKSHRAMAIDYSGNSSTSGLYAIVDQMKGSNGNKWAMNLANSASGTVSGNSFTISYTDGVTLKGVVVSPINPTITYASKILNITGGNDFFIVFTIHNGSSSTFATTGVGLGSVVTINNQSVRYDSIEKSIVLDKFNVAPKIIITNPIINNEYSIGEDILLQSNIQYNGAISKVEYWLNDVLVGTSNATPFNYLHPNILDGNYVLFAKAYSASNDVVISDPVTFRVKKDEILNMPLNLSLLQSESKFNRLTWDDNSNNEETFIVERKFNNQSFAAIGFVSKDINTFLDTYTEQEGLYTYRVKAYNRNGYSDVSNEVSASTTNVNKLDISNLPVVILVYPNPAKDILNILLTSNVDNQKYLFEIYNMKGQKVDQFSINSVKNQTTHQLQNISNIPSGNYIIVGISENKIVMSKKILIE